MYEYEYAYAPGRYHFIICQTIKIAIGIETSLTESYSIVDVKFILEDVSFYYNRQKLDHVVHVTVTVIIVCQVQAMADAPAPAKNPNPGASANPLLNLRPQPQPPRERAAVDKSHTADLRQDGHAHQHHGHAHHQHTQLHSR